MAERKRKVIPHCAKKRRVSIAEKLEGTGARLAKEVLDILVLELHGGADVGPAGFLAAEAQEERRVVRREGGQGGKGGKGSVNVRKE
jgi:hypothetical protein